ncbi:hypothetical protein S40288_09974 [Stachybotrys chartarum IBT 40288]|nr:hypothetical protein S40288_09974 [Stachybotrys chartarum IBT 40288]
MEDNGPQTRRAAIDEGIDFDITLNNSQPEQDADSTVRPNLKPADKVGAKLEPFDVPYRPFEVLELPETPLKLFQRFLPIWLVQNWANYTNNNSEAPDPESWKPQSRQWSWNPTSVADIYIWIAIIHKDLLPDKEEMTIGGSPKAAGTTGCPG